jgi:hypothetical protein
LKYTFIKSYSGIFGVAIRPFGVLSVSIKAKSALISVLFKSNFLRIGEVTGIKESRAVPKYFF